MTERDPTASQELTHQSGEVIYVVGLQYGDEGKGKIVDMEAAAVSAVARGNGGANAGHTIVLPNGEAASLHQLPSGIAYPDKQNIIGHGTLFDPVRLADEIFDIEDKGIAVSPANLAISGMAHMVFPSHKKLDELRESGTGAQGSTKAGIAFTAADHSLRIGIRFESVNALSPQELKEITYDRLRAVRGLTGVRRLLRVVGRREAHQLATDFGIAAQELSPYMQDTRYLLNDILDSGQSILIEGAQAFGLDKHHGKYPFCTSTGTTVAALMEGTGVSHKRPDRVIGVAKATPSKVGGGSFVTRINDPYLAQAIRGNKGDIDGEFGGTTGREREVGYLDLVALKLAVKTNGVDEIALTKFDCIKRSGLKTKIAVAYRLADGSEITEPPSSDADLAKCTPIYEEFPTWTDDNSKEAKAYLKRIEGYLGVPITVVSNGPGRHDILTR